MYESRAESSNASDYRKTIDLYSLRDDVLSRIPYLFLLSAAIGMLAFVLLSSRQHATYTASATLAVNNVYYTSNIDTYDMLGYAVDVSNKIKGVIGSSEMKSTVADDLGYDGFKGSLSAELVGDSNLLRISVKSDSPYTSFMEVKSILRNYRTFADVLSGGARFTVLEQPTIQDNPVLPSGNTKKAGVVFLGVFALGCFILIVLSLRKETVHSGSDVTQKVGTDYLGDIYRVKGKNSKGEVLITDPAADQRYSEGFRRLAVRIAHKMQQKDQRVLLVTSAQSEEGKSIAAANIAIALSQLGNKVVLADMDFVDPSIAKILNGAEPGSGDLVSFLEKNAKGTPDEIGRKSARLVRRLPDTGLWVLLSRKKRPQLTDQYVKELCGIINTLRENADIVVINAAALSDSGDAGELAAMADTSALVIRRHKVEIRELKDAVSTLGGSEHVLGCMMSDAYKYSVVAENPETEAAADGIGNERGAETGSRSAGRNPGKRANDDVISIDLVSLMADYLKEIRKYFVVILAVMVLIAGIAVLGTRRSSAPTYTVYSTFTVNPMESVKYRVGNQKNISISLVGKMFPSLITSDAMKAMVKEDLGLEAAQSVPASISASVVQNANLVKVTVKAADPQVAYDVDQAVLRNCTRIGNAALGSVKIDLVNESGIPGSPDGVPSGRKMILFGMIFGLFACLAALLFKTILRGTVVSEEELKWAFNLPYFGNIPWVSGKKKGYVISVDSEDIPYSFVEPVRSVRGRVEKEALERGAKTIMVTSAVKAEGKTTAAASLALSLASNRHKVLLIDGDLRNPSALRALGMEQRETGLTDLLAGEGTLEQVLVPYKGRENLSILPGGKAVDDPYKLWCTPEAEQLMRELREQYEFVIVDGPSSAVFADGALIAELADTCLFVVRRDYAKVREISEGLDLYKDSNCKVMGCVMRS